MADNTYDKYYKANYFPKEKTKKDWDEEKNKDVIIDDNEIIIYNQNGTKSLKIGDGINPVSELPFLEIETFPEDNINNDSSVLEKKGKLPVTANTVQKTFEDCLRIGEATKYPVQLLEYKTIQIRLEGNPPKGSRMIQNAKLSIDWVLKLSFVENSNSKLDIYEEIPNLIDLRDKINDPEIKKSSLQVTAYYTEALDNGSTLVYLKDVKVIDPEKGELPTKLQYWIEKNNPKYLNIKINAYDPNIPDDYPIAFATGGAWVKEDGTKTRPKYQIGTVVDQYTDPSQAFNFLNKQINCYIQNQQEAFLVSGQY